MLLGDFVRRTIVAIALFAVAGAIPAQEVSEAQLKAALIYNFILFSAWPAATPPPLTLDICVRANSDLHAELKALEAKTVHGKKLLVRPTDINDLAGCSVLYMDTAWHQHWQKIRTGLERRSVLTIADGNASLPNGVMITVDRMNARMVFDIDVTAARRAGLTISSQLLRLARQVR